ASSVSRVPSTSRLRVRPICAIRVPACPLALINSSTRASKRRTALLSSRPTLACRQAVPDVPAFEDCAFRIGRPDLRETDILLRRLHPDPDVGMLADMVDQKV